MTARSKPLSPGPHLAAALSPGAVIRIEAICTMRLAGGWYARPVIDGRTGEPSIWIDDHATVHLLRSHAPAGEGEAVPDPVATGGAKGQLL